MKKTEFKVSACVLLLVAVCAGAQGQAQRAPLPLPANPRYAMDHVAMRLGLGTKTVSSFVQDRVGFLWVGTQQGIYRLDGANYTYFGPEQGVPSTFVDELALAPDGTVWVASKRTLARFDGLRFVAVPLPNADWKISEYYQPFSIDSHGNLWIATNSGLLRMNGNNPNDFSLLDRNRGLPANAVDVVHSGYDGRIYFVCANQVGILDPQTNRLQIVPAQISAASERPVAVLLAAGNEIWVRTSDHMLRYDSAGKKFIAEDQGVPKANDFGVPSLDGLRNIMLPTVAGLFMRSNHEWHEISEKQGLSSDAVYAAFEDQEHALWIGYGGRGFDRWPGRRAWSGWTKENGLPDDVVWCELRDSAGRLWVGTNNGLAMWDGKSGKWRSWNEKDGLGGSIVRDLALARDGAIWALSYPGGLTRIDSKTLALKRIAIEPPVLRDPSGFAVAPDGSFWIGNVTYLKIMRQQGSSFTFEDVALPPELTETSSHPSFAPDGSFWSGSRNGLARFDGGKWLHITKKDGLAQNGISKVVPISRNEAWVRYDESLGISKVTIHDGKVSVRNLDTSRGLHSDAIALLGRDHLGDIWAGADDGITVIAPDGSPTVFTSSDGLIWDDLSADAFWEDPDGSVFLGTSRGLARYDPVQAQSHVQPLKVVLTSAMLGGAERLLQSNPATDYDHRIFEAKFAALSFHDPGDVSCRYRLHGIEDDYTVTRMREVRYSPPPPGNFQFEVACRAGTGAWSAPAIFAFRVQQPWWGRWWARLCELLALLLLVFAAVRSRTRALETERHRLEEAVALRSAELAKANLELEQAALTDPLTNARNRRFFQTTIAADVSQAVRAYSDASHSTDHRDLVVYLVDIDHFKHINDRYGHGAGDLALIEIAKRLSRAVRSSDVLVRWGGEEFLVLSRAAERKDAGILASRILNVIAAEPLRLDENEIVRTCSVGWAAFPWLRSSPAKVSMEEVLRLVDRALYMAKESGRNQAVGFFAADEIAAQDDLEVITVDECRVALFKLSGPQLTSVQPANAAEDLGLS